MKKCSSLEEARANINRIDQEVVRLIAERGEYAAQASAFKQDEEAVRDTGRVEKGIARAGNRAAVHGVSPDLAEAVYREMIRQFVGLELSDYRRQDTQERRAVRIWYNGAGKRRLRQHWIRCSTP